MKNRVKNELYHMILPFQMAIQVFMNIMPTCWKMAIVMKDHCIEMEGEEKEEDRNRYELMCTLEMLQFIRKWIPNEEFHIYINSEYVIMCFTKWIPLWYTKGFRINHTTKLRPNTDLLVKMYAFQSCMNLKFIQHYNSYKEYCILFNTQQVPIETREYVSRVV